VAYNSSAAEAFDDLKAFVDREQLELPLFRSPNSAEICVAVSTARRKNSPINYLKQCLMSLVTRMKRSDSVYIHVFNVDDMPEEHAQVEEIRKLFPVTNIKAKTATDMERKLQEGLDFADQLDVMYSWECPHSVFLEDDALAQEDWVHRVRSAIHELRPPWFAARLYVSNPAARFPFPRITNLDQGYNAVAVLFNRQYLKSFATEIRRAVGTQYKSGNKKDFEAKDVFLSIFGRGANMAPKAFEPPIFQHTGIFSSVVKRSSLRMGSYMQAPNWPSEGVPITFNSKAWAGS
jgi:hypothetical protein